jgi:hypothetical protein
MNNLLPTSVKMHEKYDLKGSTYKRKASKRERDKANPVYKDLDLSHHDNSPCSLLVHILLSSHHDNSPFSPLVNILLSNHHDNQLTLQSLNKVFISASYLSFSR